MTHCHILEHEDEGMMNIIQLTGTEGTIYSLAETLDTTCYRGSFQPSTVAPTPSMPSPSPSPTPLPLPANSCAAAARTYMEAGCCGQPAKMLDATGLTCITHRIAYQSSNCCNNPTGDFSLTPADTSSSPEAGRLLLESVPLDEMPRLELDYFWTPGSDEM